jgi:hypothetical protein
MIAGQRAAYSGPCPNITERKPDEAALGDELDGGSNNFLSCSLGSFPIGYWAFSHGFHYGFSRNSKLTIKIANK